MLSTEVLISFYSPVAHARQCLEVAEAQHASYLEWVGEIMHMFESTLDNNCPGRVPALLEESQVGLGAWLIFATSSTTFSLPHPSSGRAVRKSAPPSWPSSPSSRLAWIIPALWNCFLEDIKNSSGMNPYIQKYFTMFSPSSFWICFSIQGSFRTYRIL